MIDSPRIQRLKEKTLPFVFTARWVKGSTHLAADALSRQPVSDPTEVDTIEENRDSVNMRRYLRAFSVTIQAVHVQSTELPTDDEAWDPMLEKIAKETKTDDELQDVINAIREGKRPPKPYEMLKDESAVVDGILIFRNRIVIPRSMREEVLKNLHASHLGIVRTKQRSRKTVFWPRIGADIEDAVRKCDRCQRDLPSHEYEPIVREDDAKEIRPMEEWSADLFEQSRGH